MSTDPYWRVEGKLDKRNRELVDRFGLAVQLGLIAAYRRTRNGQWFYLESGKVLWTDGADARWIGQLNAAEQFVNGLYNAHNAHVRGHAG